MQREMHHIRPGSNAVEEAIPDQEPEDVYWEEVRVEQPEPINWKAIPGVEWIIPPEYD